jgi:hypothetical protein|uniref:Uncharacterized protein n=1 Tax=Siphoviridae sp. ctpGU1 TaxID=2823601 RepID=A0A8S5LBW8_9CAUD|nr:MAG TPA: hypothetical protein [Siphoviridae sp. ctpGU1]
MTNEELRREIEQLKQIITEMRINQLESKCEPIPTSYQVKIPSDLENYYTIDIDGSIEGLYGYTNEIRVLFYLRGLAFKTKTEAEQYLRKSMLHFKYKKWAEEHNEGWTPDWNDEDERKYFIEHDSRYENLDFDFYGTINQFSELPIFKSYEIAKKFTEEFGDEIKEVLC